MSRYVLGTGAEVVHATITLDLRNTSPDKKADGGVYTYYFDAYSVPVPAGSRAVRAVSGSTDLEVSVTDTDDPSTQLARIGFPNLRYGQSRHIVLTFDIPGAPQRSDNSTRVGPGYATFVAYGPGDEGHNVVEVVAPSSMSFTSTIDGFTPSGDGDTTTYTATENTFDGGLWAAVSFRDPTQATQTHRRRRGPRPHPRGLPRRHEVDAVRLRQGRGGPPGARAARRQPVARWAAAHPGGRLARRCAATTAGSTPPATRSSSVSSSTTT